MSVGKGYYNPKDGLDCIWLVNEDENTSKRQIESLC